MTISLPGWLLWTLAIGIGAPAVILVAVLAFFGWIALTAIGRGPWK
jgi:hypothetical protein